MGKINFYFGEWKQWEVMLNNNKSTFHKIKIFDHNFPDR